MNILILTPTHPTQIVEVANLLYNKYLQHNNITSLQGLALLAEESLQQNYIPILFTYAAQALKNPNLLLTTEDKKREHEIIFGNIDRRTAIEFDHIIGLAPSAYITNENEEYDSYLNRATETINEILQNNNMETISWYTKEDCEHIFPTLHHLEVFLKVIGVKKDGIQSESTVCN